MKKTVSMLRFLLVGSAFLIAVSGQAQNYTISGYIREAGSKELLIGVNVYVPAIKSGTVSNTYGFYSLTLPSQDSLELIYSFVGFKPVKKMLQLNQHIDLSIELEHYELKEAEVVGERTSRVSETAQMSIIDIPIQHIKDIPALLGEKDVFKVIQLLPGVQKGTEGSSGIYVRGGGPDQNLIILDDATVYNATHLFGFFSLFNGDALKSVELMKGGFPARYGGRLSSVIEMNMKEGNKEKFKGEGGIGLIASRFTVEGPLWKNKSSFLVSARRTYFDILARPFMKRDEQFGYFFYDLNAKLNYELSDKDRLYLSGYLGQDKFYVRNVWQSSDPNGSVSKEREKASLGWGNITSTMRWNHLFNNKLFSNTSFVFSDYTFSIRSDRTYKNEEYMLRYFSGIKDLTLKSDFDYYPSTKHHLRAGIQFTYHRFYPSARVVKEPRFEKESKITRIRNLENGIYLEDNFKISPKWNVQSGIRVSHFLSEDKNYVNLEPRLSVSYNVKNDLSLKASFASMNQYVHLISNTGLGLPTDLWVPATKRIAPQRSNQVAVGVAKDFLDKDLALTVEAFYKKMDHVLGYKPGANFLLIEDLDDPQPFDWEKNVTSGQGWSRGVEVLFQRKFGRFSGWVGYTLSWIQLQFDSINNGEKFYAKYDRRHDISLVGIYKAREATTDRGGITLSATWVYGTGNAITLPLGNYVPPIHTPMVHSQQLWPLYNEFSSINGFRMEAYHRFDIGVQFHKKRKRIERTWDLSVYNAYNRKNPFFYFIEYDDKTSRTLLKKAAIFPVIPSITYNFKF